MKKCDIIHLSKQHVIKERRLTSTATAHQPSKPQQHQRAIQRQGAIARNHPTVFGICRPV